ncbi:UNVERIFIED_CONTAM: hypothetical protein Slati_1328500 [Sesamum latifolium]|uniref:Retrotransposon gag domain-containing protein n=1 Tax=Sesamum latifolium TaxID=2727402 RepID=A0AAW2XHY5_9LAMI
MEGETPRRDEGPSRQTEPMMQITRSELQKLMEEAGRNALAQHERRTATPIVREAPRRQLFREAEIEREHEEANKGEPGKGHEAEGSEVGSSERERGKRREPGISRAEVDNVGRQIERLGKQIDDLKRRGEIVSQNRNSPFSDKILTEVVDPSFRIPNLPKYDGTKDPLEQVAAFELVMNLYGQSSAINAKLFVTTLTGKAQEWFTSLPNGGIETFEQLVQKFTFHFASKRKQKRSVTYLFNIRQKEDESLKNFIGRFNNETLEIQDLRIDMMVSILIHGLKKGPFASALARDPPEDVEQLIRVAQKYIDEEEINAMKDGEWQKSKDRGRWKDSRRKNVREDKERDPPYRPNIPDSRQQRNTPASIASSTKKKGHDTEDCYQLKDEIERLVRQGYFKEYKLERDEPRDHRKGDSRTRSRSKSRDRFRGKEMEDRRNAGSRDNVPVKGVINTIAGCPGGGDSRRSRKQSERTTREDRRKEWVLNVETEEEITFGPRDVNEKQGSQDDPMDVIKWMGLENSKFSPVMIPLVGFGGSEVASMGTIDLPVSMGEEPRRRTTMVRFLVVDTPFAYNVILGRPGLNLFRAVVSTYHLKMKFPTKNSISEVSCDQKEARRCYNLSLQKGKQGRPRRKVEEEIEKDDSKRFKAERMEPVEEHRSIELVVGQPNKTTRIGSSMNKSLETMMIEF